VADEASGAAGWSEQVYEVLSAWLADHDVHDEEGFEALCGHHPPDVAEQLRAHRRGILDAEETLGRRGAYERHVLERLGRRMRAARGRPAVQPVAVDDLRALAARDDLARRYEVVGPVGEGGMGVIHRAWDRDLQREVAIKVLRLPGEDPRFPDDGPFDEELARREDTLRFLEEARVTAALLHPGIASVHTVGADPSGRPFFAMELLQGDGFDDVIDWIHEGRPGWSLNRGVRIVRTICEATAYAHQVGVMHRDIKPPNVLVGSLGATYLLDWGLHENLAGGGDRPAEVDRNQAADSESQDGVKGSVAYMSPEHALGRRVDERSDIYSLGALLYHLLTGRPPYFPREGPAYPPTVLRLVGQGSPPPVVDAVEDGTPVPEALVAICQKAMERAVERRYANAGQMATELGEYLEDVSEDRVEARRQAQRARRAIQWVTTVLAQRDPDAAQGEDVTVAEALARAEKRLAQPTVDSLDEAALRLMIGRLYLNLGRLDRADGHLRTAFEVYRLEAGEDDRETLASAFELGRLLREQTRFEEAEERLRATWELQAEVLGEGDVDTRRTARVLASLLVTAGKFEEGVALSDRVVEGYRSTHGARHEDTLAAMRDLCVALGKTGQRARAVEELREVLAGLEEKRGERHTETIYARAELGSHLTGGPEAADVSAAELEEAERHVLRALEDAAVVCGGDHPATLVIRQNLAQLRERQERFEDASRLYGDVLRTLRSQKQESGRLAIFARAGLGRVLLRRDAAGTDDAPLAETLLQDAAQLADGTLRPGEAGRCWTFLGDALVELERWEEAATALETAVARLGREPAEARAWQRAAETLATVYERLGRPDEASRVRRDVAPSAGRGC